MTESKITAIQQKIVRIRREAEERDAERRAERLKKPYVDLRKVPVSIAAVKMIPEERSRDAKIVGLEHKSGEVAVAAVDPTSAKAQAIIAELEKKKIEVKTFVASPSGIDEIRRMYRFVHDEAKDITGKLEVSRVEEVMKEIKGLDAGVKLISSLDFAKVNTTNLFEYIIAAALSTRASDIHFEAEEKAARLRFRLDGVLHDISKTIPERSYEALLSRIKLLSGLKINVHGEPQDGRFTIGLLKKEVEMRVSIIPSEFGETIVMRILDPDSIVVDLKNLGMRPDDLAMIEEEIKKPNGLILNTGPTGSGKTTTLYAFLRRIVNPEIKIITVEDPIEYRIEGIEQTQAHADTGYTFAGGLRAILRQDPDVILIGEIRDLETADIALQASLTGHMVFSTLHANDAIGAVPRLVDLGVKPMTIGSALNLVIAQRLVRRLCVTCKKPVELSGDMEKKLRAFVERLPSRVDKAAYKKITIFEPGGCEACGSVGYAGRSAIYEFFKGGPELEKTVLKDASIVALDALAKEQEMVRMQEDGILKVIMGITSFAEVEGVTGKIEWLKK